VTVSAATSPPSSALTTPDVAWPTALLALCAWSAQGVAFWAAWTHRWPAAAVVAVASVSAYLSFTVLHEAVHGSLCLKVRAINGVAARLAGLPLMVPGWAFRYLHLEHHRHTNHLERDPDIWNGGGRRWTLPLRWAITDLGQYAFYFRHWSTRPLAERVETVLGLAGIVAVAAWGIASGHGWALLWAWILPARIALFVLAYSFDYIVHRPHAVTSAEDRLQATRNLDVPRPVGFLLLSQDLHLVHHLHPGVPFYRYRAAWNDLREVHAVLNYMNGG
jgi:beta-carotene hydroxylase